MTSNRASVKIIEISGPALERGRQYGEQAKAQIDASVAYYSQLFEHEFGMSWAEISRRSLAWLPMIEQFDAETAEEVVGIAEGSGHELGEIVALNARGEMVYGKYMAPMVDGCTSFAVLPSAGNDGHMYCGQNWDWRAGAAGTWVVLRVIQTPKPTITMVVEAGQVGRHGANSAGIALLSNGLSGFCTPEPGVPQPFIRRKILSSNTFPEAMDVIFSARQQIASNVLLAHRDGFAIDLETTPDGHGWLYPEDGVLVHGNHYEAFSWARDGSPYRPLGPDSLYRVFRVRESLQQGLPDSADTLTTIAAAMADHFGFPDSVCTHQRPEDPPLTRWQTLTSSIIDLTSGEWRLAAGTPCEHPYEPLPWNIYDQ
jgi:isopenicillin-N N-acyltransferase like protein